MPLKLYKIDTIEHLVLMVLVIQVFLIQWLNITYRYIFIIDAAVIAYFLYRKTINGRSLQFAYIIISWVLFLGVQFLREGFNPDIFYNNCHTLICGVLIILFFWRSSDKLDLLRSALKKMHLLINLYAVINVPVLVLQMRGHFELSGKHSADATNTYVPDLISGLLGYNGTPMLSAFLCFLFIYDFWYYKNFVSKKIAYGIYLSFMLLFNLYVSTQNDNKGFFVQLFCSCALVYLAMQENKTSVKKKIFGVLWGGAGLVAVLAASLFAYGRFAPFRELVDKAARIFNTGISSTTAVGGAERFAIINYFFQSDINKMTGTGIGAYYWRQKDGFGFSHFGQNDLGPFLIMGGIIFILLLLSLVFIFLWDLNKSFILSVGELFYFSFLLLYTQPVTTCSILITTMMMFLVIAQLRHETGDEGKV